MKRSDFAPVPSYENVGEGTFGGNQPSQLVWMLTELTGGRIGGIKSHLIFIHVFLAHVNRM